MLLGSGMILGQECVGLSARICLRYIDLVALRQAVEKQLNRVELANSFTRAVAVGNPCGLEHTGKSEQEIAESCNRLIKSRTICWNCLYLIRQIEAARTPEEQDRLLRMISIHSPQAWAHFNMGLTQQRYVKSHKGGSGSLPSQACCRLSVRMRSDGKLVDPGRGQDRTLRTPIDSWAIGILL